MSTRRLFLYFFVLGAMATIAQQFLRIGNPAGGGGEMVAIAENLAQTGEYANPYTLTRKTGPTAVNPPLYPLALAGLILLFGEGWKITALLIEVVAHGILAGLLLVAARRWMGSARPGAWAAGLSLLPVVPFSPAWDAVYTADLLLVFCLFTSDWEKASLLRIGVFGALGGVVLLMNPPAGLLVLFWVMASGRGNIRSRVLALLAAGLVFAPWPLRNWEVLGEFTVKTNFGVTLYSAQNDCSPPSLWESAQLGCYQRHHPYKSPIEANLAAEMGEVAYDRMRLATALDWMREHPARVARLVARRFVEFWLPDPRGGLVNLFVSIVTLISIPGCWWLFRGGTVLGRFALWTCALYPFMYYVTFPDLRYRIPILWITLLAAGIALDRLTAKTSQASG